MHYEQNGMDRAFLQAVPCLVHLLSCGVSCDWANLHLTRKVVSRLPDEIIRPLGLAVSEEDPIGSRIEEEQFAAIAASQKMESHPIRCVERIALCDQNRVGLFPIIDNQEVPAVCKRDHRQPHYRQSQGGNCGRTNCPHNSINSA